MIEHLGRVIQRPVSRETFRKLEAYVALLKAENERQNLVSDSTLENVWDRHILDSAQLVPCEPYPGASWVDIGSGAGLPGIVVACLVDGPVTLIEPRALRARFLERVVAELSLNVFVVQARAEKVRGHFDVITGRAVAPLDRFLRISRHLSTGKTIWTLLKGKNAQSELAAARRSWQGAFHVQRSVTDEDSWIVVATGVREKP
ncbi:MAG TPA: 16S rRNA (guanine(527)-N(7))-methyltransferase RsmG [Sphingomicrobium sp.]|nr:16S rRNA (guanine(527)-N(7))-methyltransferase RsmG [Sphingomicrobium sp.]